MGVGVGGTGVEVAVGGRRVAVAAGCGVSEGGMMVSRAAGTAGIAVAVAVVGLSVGVGAEVAAEVGVKVGTGVKVGVSRPARDLLARAVLPARPPANAQIRLATKPRSKTPPANIHL